MNLISSSPSSFNNSNENFNKSFGFFLFKTKGKMVCIKQIILIRKINFCLIRELLIDICSRFITDNDLCGFQLIIASDVLLKPIHGKNRTFALFVIPLLNRSPSTRYLHI